MTPHRLAAVAVAALVALAIDVAPARAQVFNPRDDRYRTLGFIRARAEYERATAEWRRARELRERALLSDAELEEREAARVRARVDLLQQALAALDAAPHVLIERARKRRLADGGTEVELILAGTPDAGAGVLDMLAALDAPLREEVTAQASGQLFVSLKAATGPDGAIIATPYERVLPRLTGGARRRVRFRLVRDAADVVVAMDHGGRIDERRILLEADGVGAGVTLDLAQPAQEADLGAQAAYDVVMERTRDDVVAVRVAVEGLPPSAAGEVRAADSDARLSVVRFALGERTKRLRVLVALPRDEGGGVRVDSTLRFAMTALPTRTHDAAGAAPGSVGTASGEPARVEAQLVVRGVPRAELRLAVGFVEARAGEGVRVAATVRNAGSRALAGLRVTPEAPPGWRAASRPASLETLAPGSEAAVNVELVPDASAAPGDYEARLRLDGGAGDRALEGEPRVLRVRVAPAGRGWSGWLVVLVLTALLLAAARAGRRLLAR